MAGFGWKMSGTLKESRQHPRVSIAVEVDVASGSNFYAGRTRDLSLGGLFVETDVGLPIGAQIEVKLRLPSGSFKTPCEVVWQLSDRGHTIGVGVRFLQLSQAARRAIETFMSLRTPVPFEAPELDDGSDPPGPPPLPDARRSIPTPKEGPAPVQPPPLRPPQRAK
jgi:uncharacterized protein (TIGR02266 family)